MAANMQFMKNVPSTRSLIYFLFLLVLLISGTATQAQAPASLSGWTFLVNVTEGSHGFASSGQFLIIFGDRTYRQVHLADVADMTNNYSYKQNGSFGEISIGSVTMIFGFTNSSSGNYGLTTGSSATSGHQLGTFGAVAGTASLTLTGKVVSVNGLFFNGVTPVPSYRLRLQAGNKYQREDQNGTSPLSTFGVRSLSKSTIQFFFNDAIMGTGIATLAFGSGTGGLYVYKIGAGNNFQLGNFAFGDATAPLIVAQPKDQRVLPGSPATFSVVASGAPLLKYQWLKDGASIPGATASTFTIPAVSSSSVATYSVKVSNFIGSVTSSNAALTLLCKTTLSTRSVFVDFSGGLTNITVDAQCTWDVVNTNDWITDRGSVDTNLTFQILPNNNDVSRVGIVEIGSEKVVVSQGPEFAVTNLNGKTFIHTITTAAGTNNLVGFRYLSVNGILLNTEATPVTRTNLGIFVDLDNGDFRLGTFAMSKSGPTVNTVVGDSTKTYTFDSIQGGTYSVPTTNGVETGTFILIDSAPDYNQDGTADLLFQKTDGTVALWSMERGTNVAITLLLTKTNAPPTGWNLVGQSDFNDDGQVDLLWQNGSGVLVLWLMGETSMTGAEKVANGVASGSAWKVVGVSDFNRDKRPDILFQNDTGLMAVWYMKGTNGTVLDGSKLLNNGVTTGSWRVAGIADFNGDREKDILFQLKGNGKMMVWYMNGSQVVQTAPVNNGVTPGISWRAAGVNDFDYNGSVDILLQDDTGKLLVWYMDGTNLIRSGFLNNGIATGAAWRVVGPK